eukprot:TRINITY_DN2162_c0_g1_i1.p1 TRINITY_DN2162_c0_g1~~TRINITY_DN2162_c0_g1_i1.p1  ORF type:complete len:498 (-),score=140.14 TRINITY_DN2162_c0_g1_i1:3-1496(-)
MMKLFLDGMCGLGLFGIIVMAIENEVLWANGNQPSDVTTALKWLVSISTFACALCLFFFYSLKKEYFKLLGNIPSEASLMNSNLRNWFLLEFLVIIIHAPPYLDVEFKFEALGRITPYTLDMVGGLLIFLRLYLLPRFILFHSRYYNKNNLFVKVISNLRVNSIFVIKTILYFHPFRALIFCWLLVVFSTGYFIRLCERPINPEHSWYWNSLWLTVITMTTVGYGDMNPETHCGRTFAVFGAILGVSITSLTIVVISSKISLSGDEVRVVSMIEKDTQRRNFRTLACLCMQYTCRYHLAKIKGTPKQAIELKRDLYDLVGQFRASKRALHSAIAEFNASMGGAMMEDMFTRGQQIDFRLEKLAMVTLKLQKNTVIQIARMNKEMSSRLQPSSKTTAAKSTTADQLDVSSIDVMGRSSSSSSKRKSHHHGHATDDEDEVADTMGKLQSNYTKMRKNMQRIETKVDRMMSLLEALHVAAQVSDEEGEQQVEEPAGEEEK